MLMKKYIILGLLGLFLIPTSANATIDCNYPPRSVNWLGTPNLGLRLRDKTCMDSNVLGTLQSGVSYKIVGEADGWYKVVNGDTVGYVWGELMTVTDKDADFENEEPEVTKIIVKPEETKEEVVVIKEDISETKETVDTSLSLTDRLKGRILLQVESHGEAWYVHPDTGKRFYMKDGDTAYQMMRSFGLGISNKDLESAQTGDNALLERLKGKILLQVESVGEAYYVDPATGILHYMKDGAAAYQIMRNLSLGITNLDLDDILEDEFTPIPEGSDDNSSDTENETISSVDTSNIRISDFQGGSIPSNIDVVELNKYWISRINQLRSERGNLRLLQLDQRWVDTASEYAELMGVNNWTGHERADGSTMHQWIDQKGLDFTTRYSTDGWKGNYFTENISWGVTSNDMTSMKQALEATLDFYLGEASYNGAHYRTIYHEDWNSVGSGFYFVDQGNGRYKVYQVFHYGSLEL